MELMHSPKENSHRSLNNSLISKEESESLHIRSYVRAGVCVYLKTMSVLEDYICI